MNQKQFIPILGQQRAPPALPAPAEADRQAIDTAVLPPGQPPRRRGHCYTCGGRGHRQVNCPGIGDRQPSESKIDDILNHFFISFCNVNCPSFISLHCLVLQIVKVFFFFYSTTKV